MLLLLNICHSGPKLLVDYRTGRVLISNYCTGLLLFVGHHTADAFRLDHSADPASLVHHHTKLESVESISNSYLSHLWVTETVL